MDKGYEIYKPTKRQVVTPIIILAVTLVIGSILILIARYMGSKGINQSYLVPNQMELNLIKGNYMIYLENEADFEGKHYSVPEEFSNLTCELTYKGEEIILTKPLDGYSYGEGEKRGKTYLSFTIEEDGNYQLKAQIEDDKTSEAVITIAREDENSGNVIVLTVIACLCILMGILQFMGYLILNVGKWLFYCYLKKKNGIY